MPAPNYAADTRTTEDISYIGSLFPDIKWDSSAYYATGITFSDHGHHVSATTQFNVSLDLAENDNDRIYPRIQRAYAFQKLQKCNFACEDIDNALNDKSGEIVEIGNPSLDPSLINMIGRNIVSKALATEKRLFDGGLSSDKGCLLKAYTIRAECLVAQSKTNAAIDAYKQVIFLAYRDQLEKASMFFRALLQQYERIGDYRGLMQQVKSLPVDKRLHMGILWRTLDVRRRLLALSCCKAFGTPRRFVKPVQRLAQKL